jgi:tetratricopeptide (TPR) repeat protein/predicted Ser/Thr protein kinase
MTPEETRTDAGAVPPDRRGDRVPAMLGHYRVLHLVGEGGMGTVYKVEQDRPHRIVALKVIKAGLASPELLRRFERESEALARLHHPGIAQIYEVGTADAGAGPQPYFAMEFINGEPLRTYAETRRLDTRQRLELMASVCDAVDHAHQRGIIHRDLKPGNILVDERRQPKILDFGVARVTDSDAHATKQTDLGQLIGTLAYMSPEQVLADPLELDTRSDVYALGVILYELLAGGLPYDVRGGVLEAVRAIREDDPRRLSSINRAYRGDIDTIVAKSLEKEKARRYSSAAALATDIRRYLAHEPIAARPASTVYQLQKFARRHRTLVTATAVVFAVLLGSTIVSTREAVKARRAEQTAEAVNDFLQNDLLAQASAATQSGPSAKPDPDLKVRTALDRAAARIPAKFDQQPEVEASIRHTIGRTYMDLGLYPDARTQLQRALDLFRRTAGSDDPRALRTSSGLGRIAQLQGKYPEAEALLSPTLEAQRRVFGSEHPDTLNSMNNLAIVYNALGRYSQAETLITEVLETRRRVSGPEHPFTLKAAANLALVYANERKYAEAEALLVPTLAILERVAGPEHPDTLIAMNNLSTDYYQQGKFAQAEALGRRALEIRQRVLGPEHLDTLMSMTNLGNTYGSAGKYEQAVAIFSQTVETQRRVLGPDHPLTVLTMNNLAGTYGVIGKYEEAEALLVETLGISRRVLGPEHPDTLYVLAELAFTYERQGKHAVAEAHAAQALALRRRVLGSQHPDTMASAASLALIYLTQGKFAESEQLAREALAFYGKSLPDDWKRFDAESVLGASLAGQKKFSEAEPMLLEGYQGMVDRTDRIDVPLRFFVDDARRRIVELYQAWGKPDKAAEWRRP